MRLPKDLRSLAASYKKAGWTIAPAGSGHAKWSCPNGHVVTATSSTPSNPGRVAKATTSILAKHYCEAVAA